MGIYDQAYNPGFNPGDLAKYAKYLAVIALLLVLYLGFTQVQEAFKPRALELRLAKDKIKPTENVTLSVKVTNVSGADARDVVLLVKARDNQSISITPLTTKIVPSLPANEWRQLDFLVDPVGTIAPGGYTLDVQTVLNGKPYAANAVVNVEG